jgi:VanZ family protein
VQLSSPPYRYLRIWLVLGWGLVVSVVVLSLVPLSVDLGEGRDKVGHFLSYGGLTFWFGMLYAGRGRQLRIAIAFSAMGVALEFLQGLTDYRSFEIADMIANAVGAGIGWCAVQTPVKNGLHWLERFIGKVVRSP